MKRIDFGQTISILANVGVIAGIVFLGLELRQNNQQMAQEATALADARANDIVNTVIENPALIDLMAKPAPELTRSERDRLTMLGIRLLLTLEQTYEDMTLGLRTEEETVRILRSIYHRDRLNYGAPMAWQTYKSRADPSFVEFFEEEIVEP